MLFGRMSFIIEADALGNRCGQASRERERESFGNGGMAFTSYDDDKNETAHAYTRTQPTMHMHT